MPTKNSAIVLGNLQHTTTLDKLRSKLISLLSRANFFNNVNENCIELVRKPSKTFAFVHFDSEKQRKGLLSSLTNKNKLDRLPLQKIVQPGKCLKVSPYLCTNSMQRLKKADAKVLHELKYIQSNTPSHFEKSRSDPVNVVKGSMHNDLATYIHQENSASPIINPVFNRTCRPLPERNVLVQQATYDPSVRELPILSQVLNEKINALDSTIADDLSVPLSPYEPSVHSPILNLVLNENITALNGIDSEPPIPYQNDSQPITRSHINNHTSPRSLPMRRFSNNSLMGTFQNQGYSSNAPSSPKENYPVNKLSNSALMGFIQSQSFSSNGPSSPIDSNETSSLQEMQMDTNALSSLQEMQMDPNSLSSEQEVQMDTNALSSLQEVQMGSNALSSLQEVQLGSNAFSSLQEVQMDSNTPTSPEEVMYSTTPISQQQLPMNYNMPISPKEFSMKQISDPSLTGFYQNQSYSSNIPSSPEEMPMISNVPSSPKEILMDTGVCHAANNYSEYESNFESGANNVPKSSKNNPETEMNFKSGDDNKPSSSTTKYMSRYPNKTRSLNGNDQSNSSKIEPSHSSKSFSPGSKSPNEGDKCKTLNEEEEEDMARQISPYATPNAFANGRETTSRVKSGHVYNLSDVFQSRTSDSSISSNPSHEQNRSAPVPIPGRGKCSASTQCDFHPNRSEDVETTSIQCNLSKTSYSKEPACHGNIYITPVSHTPKNTTPVVYSPKQSPMVEDCGSPLQSPIRSPQTQCCYTHQGLIGSETRVLEFKEGGGRYVNKYLFHDVSKYLCSFLNSEGGTLMVGVNDNGYAVGVPINHRREDLVRLQIDGAIKSITPHIFPQMYSVDFVPIVDVTGQMMEDLKVIEITVQPGNSTQLYETNRGEVYIRRDGSVQGPLKASHIQEWTKMKLHEEQKLKDHDYRKSSERNMLVAQLQENQRMEMEVLKKLENISQLEENHRLLKQELEQRHKREAELLVEIGRLRHNSEGSSPKQTKQLKGAKSKVCVIC